MASRSRRAGAKPSFPPRTLMTDATQVLSDSPVFARMFTELENGVAIRGKLEKRSIFGDKVHLVLPYV